MKQKRKNRLLTYCIFVYTIIGETYDSYQC